MTALTEQPTVAITISEEFPLIACRECSARYVLIAIVGEGSWMAQTGGYYCPYCGHKVEIAGEQKHQESQP